MIWFLSMLSAFLLGLSRGGLKGIGPLYILLMVMALGARNATGVVVPLLILGDVLALFYYKNSIVKKQVIQFLPPVLLGVLIGAWIGQDLSDLLFKNLIAGLIIIGMIFMWIWDYYLKKEVQSSKTSTALLGIGSGFYAMIGNFAGVLATVYFLLSRLPKKELIGTATFIFFVVNLIKLPVHIYIWETIDLNSLKTDLFLIPAMLLGFFVGLKIVDKISEKHFRQFLYIVTILGTFILLFK